jgi:predicted Zn-dependent peptidase
MISYEEEKLSNGLQLIVHRDSSTPMAAVNLTYKVGARDENPERTGFAHLFEHLMFGGSANIPSYDAPLQAVGGENNAFTSNDITNYYVTLPKNALETALWLESDRMLELAFSEKSLEVQRNVVIEEFNQRYLNQPYGDAYLLLRPLAYLKHPYRWPTIGSKVEHIQEASMQEVKDFFYRFYRPNNAVLTIAGDFSMKEVLPLVKKWFGDIPAGEEVKRNYPQEDQQLQARQLTVEREVPLDAIYKVFHMPDRMHPDYYTFDLLSDILSRGDASRLYRRLVKGKKLFTDAQAYIGGEFDPGLFTFSGFLNPTTSMEEGEEAIWEEIKSIQSDGVTEEELQMVKNKVITAHAFGQTSALNKAMSLGIAAVIDQPDLINQEVENYKKVSVEDIERVAKEYLIDSNASTLYYRAKKNNNG